MPRNKKEMARPFIYPEDARTLKKELGKKYNLVTYADIIHQVILNEQNKEESVAWQIKNNNSRITSLEEEISEMGKQQKSLLAQIKAMSLMQSALVELMGDYVHRTQYNLVDPDYGYLAQGTGTDSGEWQEALEKAKDKIKNAQERKASHLGGKNYE